MESADLTLTIAEIAVAVAGFSAIVVMLNAKPISEWDDTDRLNLRLLVQVAIFTILMSLLPSVLSVSLSDTDVWKYGLWAYGLIHIVDVSSFLFGMTKETPNIFRNAALCGVMIAITQIAVALLGTPTATEMTYVTTLVWHLCTTFMAFVLLLYGVRKSN